MNLRWIMRELRIKPKQWKGEWFNLAEHKYDGHRMTIVRHAGGGIQAFGRKWHIDLWPQLSRCSGIAEKMRTVRPGTVVDGECVAGEGSTSTDVITALNDRSASFVPFAVPYYAERSQVRLTADEGRKLLRAATPWEPPALMSDLQGLHRSEILSRIRSARIEGLVLKIGHYAVWYKLKPLDTIDAVVTGIIPGEGKHEGRMGSLCVGLYNEGLLSEVGRVGGWNDDERDVTLADVFGRVLEVKCEGLAAKGRLKFARRIRWRDDKPAIECGIDQLESL